MSHLMNTYSRLPIAFTHGQGCRLFDEQGKSYLDALAGIAVNTLGHAHPRLTQALSAQIGRLMHTSNLYRVREAEVLSDRLAALAGMDEVFFCNSGCEANEAAIKLARYYGHGRGIDAPAIVVMEQAFHGRTLATIAAGGQSNLGTAADYPRKNPLENRYQFADTLTWTRGKHTMKFGFDFMNTNDLTDLLFNRTGTYTYQTWSNFAADFSGNTTNTQRWQRFTQTIGNPVVQFDIRDYAFFFQDQYKITSRFTLNLGVRYDYSDLPTPTTVNPDYPSTGRIPEFKKGWAPRVGFAYSLDSQSKTVLRAGYGMFYGRYPGGLINTLFLGNGIYQKSITLNGPADYASGPIFPFVLPSNSTTYNPPAGSVSLNIAASDFRNPYTQQGDIAIERQLGSDMALSVSGIWSRGLHLTSVQDINVGAPGPTVTYRINDASGNQVDSYSTPVFVLNNRVDRRYTRVNIIDSSLNSWYSALAVQLTKRYRYGVSGNVSYTWAHAIDEGQGGAGTPNIFASGGPQSYRPGDYTFEKGSSALDVRHRLVINGMWTPTFTKSNALWARYLVNGWGLSSIITLQSAPAVSPTVQITGGAFTPTGFTTTGNNSLNGYSTYSRVPFLPASSVLVDQIRRVDARIQKSFTITERFRAQFSFDAFNLFNSPYFTAVNSRQYIYSVVGGVPTLNPATGFGAGTAAQGFPDGTNARRLQLGLRLLW